MPKNSKDHIYSALKQYENIAEKSEKKAVLLCPEGGYFLYGNRFCSIEEYDLEVLAGSSQIQGDSVIQPLFLCVCRDVLTAAGIEQPEYISLIFHIGLEDGELLRGILLGEKQEAELVLFTDEKIENLYRMSRRLNKQRIIVSPDDTLSQQAEDIRKNDLQWLTELYLSGKRLAGNLPEKHKQEEVK